MSVTTPIFRSGAWATDGATDAGADASVEASTDGAATDGAGACDADGVGGAPRGPAESRMATPVNSVRPRERVRMCPPRHRAPTGRSFHDHAWSGSVSKNRSPPRADIGAS